MTLLIDRERMLPETDPPGRQITIGQGTFLELLDIAARERGFRTDISEYPEGGADSVDALPDVPVARVRFVADDGGARDPLFAQVPHRRSNKEPYDMERPLTPTDADAIDQRHRDATIPLSLVRDGPLVGRLRDLTREAMLLELNTPHTLRESIELTRIGADEIARHRDGIDLHGPMFWWLKSLGLMTREKAMQPGTLAFQGGIDYALGWADATPAFGWIATRGNSRIDQLRAGRAYVRLNLIATELGVAMHPVSQLLQEYPEMAGLRRRFYDMVAPGPDETIQMLFRLGYADPAPPSPRRNLTDLLRT